MCLAACPVTRIGVHVTACTCFIDAVAAAADAADDDDIYL